jgi:hypothetical protein
MEPEEEPRNARETPRRMVGHGSAGASPYRQGGGHGRAWGHRPFSRQSRYFWLRTNHGQEAKVRASWNSALRSCGGSPGKAGLRACPEIRFWVAQATGLYRPATRRAERGWQPQPINTGLLEEPASVFRSASRRPARAGRPCYPFSGGALSALPSRCSLAPPGWLVSAPIHGVLGRRLHA